MGRAAKKKNRETWGPGSARDQTFCDRNHLKIIGGGGGFHVKAAFFIAL